MKNSVHAFEVKSNNRLISQKSKELSLLDRALKKDKKQTSLDFYKIATGDLKENQRLKMKQYQQALKSN